jgi:hypothetical protein
MFVHLFAFMLVNCQYSLIKTLLVYLVFFVKPYILHSGTYEMVYLFNYSFIITRAVL